MQSSQRFKIRTDLAIFCIDKALPESEIKCSLKNLNVAENEITWSVWSPDTSLSITMDSPIVYTYNVREHSIHSENSFTGFEEATEELKACTRKATVQSVGCTTMNNKHKSTVDYRRTPFEGYNLAKTWDGRLFDHAANEP